MIIATGARIEGKEIRGTDVPIEYILIFAFVFIGTIGGFVGYQVKQSRSSLPIASGKRLDWLGGYLNRTLQILYLIKI